MSEFLCTEECWTQQTCPTCGNNVPPRGRSTPLELGLPLSCCEPLQHSDWNKCHAWSEQHAREEWAWLRSIKAGDA